MFGRSTGTFDRLVDKATSQLLLEPDWDSILAICDAIRGDDVQPKYAVAAIKKKVSQDNPHVSMFALQTLESCVKNCGSLVHDEIATKESMEFFKDLVKKRPDPVKAKVLELIQIWSQAFRNEPGYKVVQDTFQIMKMEGYSFPTLKEADAMFMAEKAPEWRDGECCHRCRVQFSTFQRKHHCRNCGQVFCNRCSSKSSIIPKYGIEKEVRVCEACYDSLNKIVRKPGEDDLPAEYLNSPLAQQPQVPGSKTDTDQQQEEEDLQLAIALSKSEAEEKEKTRQRMSLNYTGYGTSSEAPVYSEPAKVAAPAVIDTSDMDPELARYLNRNYWQQKQEDIKTTTTPSAPAAATEAKYSTAGKEAVTEESVQKYENGTESDSSDQEQFLHALKSSIEIFVNRMKSNSMRGRSIANDSSVQTLFMTVNAMHPQLMKYVSEQEDARTHYEGLQDKLVQLKDAREALDALREEHREKRRREQEELERIRQIQMAQKLEVLRQKKHEYLEYQRQLALQRMQEQEREMQMRFEQQKQMQHMRAMQYGSMQYPQMYAPQMGQTFSPGGSAEGSPLHQAHPQAGGPYAPMSLPPGGPGPMMSQMGAPIPGGVPASQPGFSQPPFQGQMTAPPGGYQPQGGYQPPPTTYQQAPGGGGFAPPTTAQPPSQAGMPTYSAGPVSMTMEFPSFSMQSMAGALPQQGMPPGQAQQGQGPPPQGQAPPGQQQYMAPPQGQYQGPEAQLHPQAPVDDSQLITFD